MSNNDKFIRDTEFGKLMECKENVWTCGKCKYYDNDPNSFACGMITNYLCLDRGNYYFAKDETDESEKV